MPDPSVVLITGSREGIGRYLVEHFVKRGALVEGCSRGQPDWQLDGYRHHIADVSDERQVRALLDAIRKRHGHLDIVVNNAGVASMNHVLLTPVTAVERIMRTNVHGTFLVCRESIKLMKKYHYGRIINLGSVAEPLRLAGE